MGIRVLRNKLRPKYHDCQGSVKFSITLVVEGKEETFQQKTRFRNKHLLIFDAITVYVN